MLIKNKSRLERKHPDFENEIGIISSLAKGVSTIVNTDLVDFVSSYHPEWTVDTKNFFLSSQPKELNCRNENNKIVFSQLFEKDGFCFSYHIYDSELLSIACETDVADTINILIFTGGAFTYNIDFCKENNYGGSFVLTVQNGQPVLEKYTFDKK